MPGVITAPVGRTGGAECKGTGPQEGDHPPKDGRRIDEGRFCRAEPENGEPGALAQLYPLHGAAGRARPCLSAFTLRKGSIPHGRDYWPGAPGAESPDRLNAGFAYPAEWKRSRMVGLRNDERVSRETVPSACFTAGMPKSPPLNKKDPMPWKLLKECVELPLPRTFSEPNDVDCLAICLAAGYIDASIPDVLLSEKGSRNGTAIVYAVLPKGRRALALHGHEKDDVALFARIAMNPIKAAVPSGAAALQQTKIS
jgi:hypothetical protein